MSIRGRGLRVNDPYPLPRTPTPNPVWEIKIGLSRYCRLNPIQFQGVGRGV
jgi:hypothetical protein